MTRTAGQGRRRFGAALALVLSLAAAPAWADGDIFVTSPAQQNAATRIRALPNSALRSPQFSVCGLKMTARPARPKPIPIARRRVISSDRNMAAPIATHSGVV